ncbi:unnamed protein product (macronuclear) [Paramecium tetraurelia]|uniref:DIX domain-containing protein n=1 Tax=Paramecium tetraurelia TaxID=5888 RepID=A0DDT9_PARTE|nr:uncharacterized protein GSPATT00016047001 [Paramecium tetraurelia]CAK81206.1 unnamed protein product [Paramecium tetraurelia]|eukprot:XP_001448603.1 hypothetical protein (macronuclear) [Paramecium tetraurelia strain d4-2]
MSNKNYTMIHYHIPQDLDDPEQPNAYTLQLNIKDITYTDILKTFPIKGQFDFKFLYQHQKENFWLDIKSNATPLPIVNKHIHIRAERVQKPQETQPIQIVQPLQQSQPTLQQQNDLMQF